ncbi:sulfatase-like hydrolase/transferase [Parapedobacter sp. SGR-10]|uniref:sulfatase-like hydrolase/transferase n=1 Tax=Parapedobacter sp. SGR-10 TaxID=2710879 RepID=UPI001F10000F|nr:sulfatase-like hydrolase/transferase [Parapedobacter sp. SGR-10]
MDIKKILLILCLMGCGVDTAWSQQVTARKLNIIFILVDDLGYGDLGVLFQKTRQHKPGEKDPWLLTPNLDQMAKDGAILSHHYAAAPVCAPSRASLLLGVSQGHANVRDNQFDKALEDNYTLGNVLQKAGYTTAAIGKWGLQGEGEPPHWPAHPLKRGFDYYFGYIAHVDGHEHYPKEGIYRGSKQVWENNNEISRALDKCYTGDLFTAVAKKYIVEHQQKQGDQPFFMYLAYDTPHAVLELPTQAYPKGQGLHGGIRWLGTPGHMINTASGTVDSYVYPQYANAVYDHDKDPATPEIPWPDTYKRYASVTFRIDEQIGDILQLLKDLKIEDNTLVVFTSDNGPSNESYLPKTYVSYQADFFHTFGPFDGIKRDLYEGGLRVPTIAWWPGTIETNTEITSANISYDWLPTFTELAGYSAPVRSDGVSLVSALTKRGQQPNSLVYAEYFHPGTVLKYSAFVPERQGKRRKQMQMLRVGDTVGVRYDVQSANDDFEIYDVVHDPQQKNNLASERPSLQQYMKARVLQVRMSDTSAARPYDQALIPSVKNPVKLGQGLTMKNYQANTPWIPDTRGMKPISVSVVADPAKAKISSNMAVFEGYIDIPSDGEYTFYISAGHKAFIRIHDVSLIDADYQYTQGEERQANVRLRVGYHPIKIYSMTNPEDLETLNLQWSYKGQPKEKIPDRVFYH